MLLKLHRLRAVPAEQSKAFSRDVLDDAKELEFLELLRTDGARVGLNMQRRLAAYQTPECGSRASGSRHSSTTDNYRANRPEIASKATDSHSMQSRRHSAATWIMKLNGLKYFPTPVHAAEHSSSTNSRGSRRSLSSCHHREKHIEPFVEEERTDRIDLTKYNKSPE